MGRGRPAPSGRRGTSNAVYRANRAVVLAQSDLCGICGHGGAQTADHIIGKNKWLHLYGTLGGFDNIGNLQPAHGTMGNQRVNPCPTCRRLCNQSRGERPLVTPHSRKW